MSDLEFYDAPTRSCPDEIRLAAFVDGGLEPQDRVRLEQHVADCAHCLGQVSALVRLQDAGLPEVDPELVRRARAMGQPKVRAQWTLAWRWAAACAATASLAIIATLGVKPPQPPERESIRAGYVHRLGPELVLPREGAAMKPNAVEFRWTASPRALFYEIRVLTADGDLLWQTRAEGLETRPPAEVTFRPGQRYFVTVSAWLPEGNAAKSGVVGFQVIDP